MKEDKGRREIPARISRSSHEAPPYALAAQEAGEIKISQLLGRKSLTGGAFAGTLDA